jgi:hypothetical protein
MIKDKHYDIIVTRKILSVHLYPGIEIKKILEFAKIHQQVSQISNNPFEHSVWVCFTYTWSRTIMQSSFVPLELETVQM